MDTNSNLNTTFYKYLNKYNEIIKKYHLNIVQNQSEYLSSEQSQYHDDNVSNISEESHSLSEQSPISEHSSGSESVSGLSISEVSREQNDSIVLQLNSVPEQARINNDIEGYKSRIYNVIVFLKKYPNLLNILPDENMTSRRIKFFLSSSYNELFFDKDVFLNVWMDFFKWKLTYTDLNDPPCR